jgi:NADH-quinone oxidoreductase subunit L
MLTLLGAVPTAVIGPSHGIPVHGGVLALAPLVIGLPLLSAAVLLLLGRRADRWGHWLGVLVPLAGFVVSAMELFQLLGRPADQRVLDLRLFDWIDTGTLHLQAGLRIDPLSLTFVLLVTFVGTLIHVYSVAYMEHDKDRRRFFAYMNLFVAAMLLLVLADSYVLLFVGWEGVGLASYLLIGFWNYNPVYAAAAKKAFVANRVGDVGLIVAMGLLFTHVGALDFNTVEASVSHLSPGVLTAIGLMLLLAACGKSAQFPLQSWLGDAMAGPTPVSALIHAATMVTAGVYLVVRSNAIFSAAPDARLVVTIVGAVSLLFGAIVGCAKDDIKKALAASTMSQIGYMMLAAGLGPIGYAFAILHLVTHGFFKAGLFLGAGSVMHGMDDQTDMRRFGGIGRSRTMQITYFTMLAGLLAIIGLIGFSGYWSKDPIIESAFVPQGGETWRAWVFGLVALVGAGITAFYMSRLFFMTFEGKKRWAPKSDGTPQHPHEAPALMTVPMIILAIGSVGLGAFLAVGSRFTSWLEPVTGAVEHAEPVLPAWVLIVLTQLLMVAGVALAWRRYAVADVPVTPPVGTLVTQAARKDLYQDVVNDAVLVVPGRMLTRSLVFGDRAVVDGTVSGIAKSTVALGDVARKVQTGHVRSYAATMTLGIVALAVVVLILGH